MKKLVIVSVAAVAVAFSGFAISSTEAAPTALGTVVGIEKHSNPMGDRWITIQPVGNVYGLWVTEACGTSLALGDDWPSANAACQ